MIGSKTSPTHTKGVLTRFSIQSQTMEQLTIRLTLVSKYQIHTPTPQSFDCQPILDIHTMSVERAPMSGNAEERVMNLFISIDCSQSE